MVSTSLAALLLVSVFTLAFASTEAQAAASSRVRVAHLSPDAPNVDIYVNGTKTLSNVPYKTVSDYLTVPSGNYRFAVRPAGAPAKSKAVIVTDAVLYPNKDYTVAAINVLAEIEGAIYEDDNSAPVVGETKVRVLHASPDAPAVDIAVKNGPVLIKELRFSDVSENVAVRAGTYDLEVRVANTNTVALALPGVALEAGKIYTVFAVNKVASLGVVVKAVAGVVDPHFTSRVRVAHLSPDAPNVDIYVNGAKVLTNVPYKTVSDYLTVPSGTYNFQVRPAGAAANSPAVIDVTTELGPREDYTVAAINFLANIEGTIITDFNDAPAAGKAKLRVFHASPDAPNVDVGLKNGRALFEDVEFGYDGGPIELNAGTYNLEVRVAGTNTVALALPGVTLQAGKVYTVFAVNKVANLGVVVSAVPGVK